MKLNLQIIKEDLKDLNLQGRILDDRLERQLTRPGFWEDHSEFDRTRLYVVEAAQLSQNISPEKRISILCIGEPEEHYIKGNCNILFTTVPITLSSLLNRLTDVFLYYYQWEKEMERINQQKLPLRSLGLISHKIFNKPFALFEANFKTVFSLYDPSAYDVPENYQFMTDEIDFMSLDAIKPLKADPEFLNASNEIEPAIYSGKLFGNRTLFYNLRINGVYVARICIDEIGSLFNDRDFALIKVLADYILTGMQQKDLDNLNQPQGLHEILTKLLDHIMIPEEKIREVLRENQWSINDRYSCFCIETDQKDKNNDVTTALIFHISRIDSNSCHIIYHNQLIFIFNLTKALVKRDEIQRIFCLNLEKFNLKAGISNDFSDFKNLYYFFEQAREVLTIGKKVGSKKWIYQFEDYNLEYLLEKCNVSKSPEIFCPEGLLRLIDYDIKKGKNNTELLSVFLENNMNIAKTIRQTFLHRSSFLHRLEKINEILNMDLNHSDTRLLLQICLKLLKKSNEKVN